MTAPIPGRNKEVRKLQSSSDGGTTTTTTTTANNKGPSSSNVRVVSRIRPLAKYEMEKGCRSVVMKLPTLDDDNDVYDLSTSESLQVNQGPNEDPRWFELDAVFDDSCTQELVYKKSGAYHAITEDLFQGFNCTILAYGQTGAGKTFTMGTASTTTTTGSTTLIGEYDGVIPRACHDLFATIQSKCDSNAHVELSYLEVYNEEIRDLLNPSSSKQELRIRETLNGEVYVRGLQARTVSTPADVGKVMEEASGRRVVASTKMNAVSSRSHAICVLKIKGVLEDSTKFQSKLTLVDLAGSERIKKTQASGNRAQEGININKGLFVLGQCVSALAEQRPKFKRKPPFRDSKLTRLLQDSLGGNSRTIMIACCSPADFNLEETINTLRYATQARNIKNSATANVVQQISQEEAMKLQRENQLLKQEIIELQETIRKLTENVTMEDLERSQSLMDAEIRKSQRHLYHHHHDIHNHHNNNSALIPMSPLPMGSPLGPNCGSSRRLLSSSHHSHLPPMPETEIPPPGNDEEEEKEFHEDDDNEKKQDYKQAAANKEEKEEEDDDDDNDTEGDDQFDDDASMDAIHVGSSSSPPSSPGSRKNGGSSSMSLDAHFEKQTPLPHCKEHAEDEQSMALSELFPTLQKDTGIKKTYEELERENVELQHKLERSQADIRATVHAGAIELPALKVRVMMLEEELNETAHLEMETLALKQELDEAKADRESAQRAAKQLSMFMEKQKTEFGFRGDEFQKKRLWYFQKRLDEKWVNFVVVMLKSFKEQMRLLGDYFDMVVNVVESPDILTMLGPQKHHFRKPKWFGAFGGGAGGGADDQHATQEKELRHRLLTEHIKFFNARLLEIEDEINIRSEAVDAIFDGLNYERQELENELDENDLVRRDVFSKKGEKLLKHLTELMTGPLFTLPTLTPGKVAA